MYEVTQAHQTTHLTGNPKSHPTLKVFLLPHWVTLKYFLLKLFATSLGYLIHGFQGHILLNLPMRDCIWKFNKI